MGYVLMHAQMQPLHKSEPVTLSNMVERLLNAICTRCGARDAVATRSDMAATYPIRCCWRPSSDCRCRRSSSGERLHAGAGDASSPAHATFQLCFDTQIQVLSVSHYLCVLNIAVLPTLPEFLPTADLVRITSTRALHKVEGLMMDDVTTVKDEIKRWKMASQEEAGAGSSIQQEFLTHTDVMVRVVDGFSSDMVADSR